MAASSSVPHPASGPARRDADWIDRRFALIDDGAGGRLSTWRRRMKFWLRCRWHAASLRRTFGVLADPRLAEVAESDPWLALRPLRSYARRGLTAELRAQVMASHFGWFAEHMPAVTARRLYAVDGVPLLDAAAGLPEGIGMVLAAARGLGREGELALHLQWHGTPVMSLAFSVVDAALVVDAAADAPAGRCLVVGSLQGRRDVETLVGALSTAAHRLRPAALLITAVQALATGWGVGAPLCIARGSHAYAGYASSRRRISLDYDAAWSEAQGTRVGTHYWQLPACPVLRPEAEVESKKRAQHRRRNVLRSALFATLAVRAVALLSPSR